MNAEDYRIAVQMRPKPADFAPALFDDRGIVSWSPPVGSKCSPLGFRKRPDADAIANVRYREALLEAAWQALEIERITGNAPVLQPVEA